MSEELLPQVVQARFAEPVLPHEYARKGFALFSGGKDSLLSAILMERQRRLQGVLFIDTTINTPDCVNFVKETCDAQGWPLQTIHPNWDYETFVMKFGFPHSGFHRVVMNRLKLHAIQNFVRQYRKDNDDRPLFFSGVRKAESKKRGRIKRDYNQGSGAFFFQPIHHYSTEERNRALERFGFTKFNPTYDYLHYSGDCLCGAYSAPREMNVISIFYPAIAKRLAELEARAEYAGIKNCRWGNQEGFTELSGATTMEGLLCSACAIRGMNPTATNPSSKPAPSSTGSKEGG